MKQKLLSLLVVTSAGMCPSLTLAQTAWDASNDGYYAFYNESEGKFISGNSYWGTGASQDLYPMPVKISNSTLTFKEGMRNYFFETKDGVIYTDGTAQAVTINKLNNGKYEIASTTNTGKYYVASGSQIILGDSPTEWTLLNSEDVAKILNERSLGQLKTIAQKANNEITITSEEDLANNFFLHVDYSSLLNTQGNGEKYQPSTKLGKELESSIVKTFTFTAPKAGIYKIEIPAMYRQTWNDVASNMANQGADYYNVTISTDDYSTMLASFTKGATETSLCNETANITLNDKSVYVPNSQSSFGTYSDKYLNAVYAYASAANQEIKVNITFAEGQWNGIGNWIVWNLKNAKITCMTLATAAEVQTLLDQYPTDKKMNAKIAAETKAVVDEAQQKITGDDNATFTKGEVDAISAAVEKAKANVSAYDAIKAQIDANDAIQSNFDESGKAKYAELTSSIVDGYNNGTIDGDGTKEIAALKEYLKTAAKAQSNGTDMTVAVDNADCSADGNAAWSNGGVGTFHTNTWSGEGNTDGSNMVTPFIEYWIASGSTLADCTIQHEQITGLQQGTYEITALVRVYNEMGYDEKTGFTGISMFANNQSIDPTKGATVCTTNDTINKGIYNTASLKVYVDKSGTLDFGFKVEKTNANWLAFKNVTLKYIGNEGVDYTLANEYGTLMLPYDAATPEGMEVFSCETINGTYLTLIPVTDGIKANTPYLVKGTSGVTYNFNGIGTATESSYTNGVFTGVFVRGTVAQNNYVLQNHDGKLAFYKVTSGDIWIAPNRCYLTVPSTSAGVKAFFFDGDATGIENVEAADATVNVYSVNGTLVRANVKASEALNGLAAGVYVVNGEKKMVK